MPLSKADKPVFDFSGGLFTEASPLNQPDGTTLDEENFELLLDGSRRRRRGIAPEGGGSAMLTITTAEPEVRNVNTYRIEGAGGNPENDLKFLKHRDYLYWWRDIRTWNNRTIYSYQLIPIAGCTAADIVADTVSFSSGNGSLYVSGSCIETFRMDFQDNGNYDSINFIRPRRRWFEDVNDGIEITERPGLLTDEHEFNLINRGWSEENITEFFNNPASGWTAAYPAKTDIWWKGYVRVEPQWVEQTREADWEHTFKGEKLYIEAFGNQSAPTGALITDLYNTNVTYFKSATLPPPQYMLCAKAGQIFSDFPGYAARTTIPAGKIGIEIQFAGLVSVVSPVTNSGGTFTYPNTSGGTSTYDLSGSHALVYNDQSANTRIEYHVDEPADYLAGGTPVPQLVGTYTAASGFTVPSPPGYTMEKKANANAFYAGRLWLSTDEFPLGSYVFFSQIALSEGQAEKMFQAGDPTSEDRGDTVPNDGGFVEISGLFGVRDMRQIGSSLVIFAKTGIWEIRGGEGFFSATDYLVRKISDVDCLSPNAIVEAEGIAMFASTQGVYVISPDQTSGLLTATSITEESIDELYQDRSSFPLESLSLEYDSYSKRLWVLYTDAEDSIQYTGALIYDLRLQAWSKYTWSSNGRMFAVMPTFQESDLTEYNKMQFLCIGSSNNEVWAFSFNDEEKWSDFTTATIGTETTYDAFLNVGYDNTGDWQRQKNAPYILTYMEKTETGFTASGDELLPVNESWLEMTTKWNWSDHTKSGKESEPIQIYKHRRLYTPVDVNDDFDNGQPVLVNRNKVRGRGRALNLYFYSDGTEEKPAHLLGWAIQYGSRRGL